jgi:hypothetical protein
LMIMPGRSWVAGIDIAEIALLTLIYGFDLRLAAPTFYVLRGLKCVFYTACPILGIAAELDEATLAPSN